MATTAAPTVRVIRPEIARTCPVPRLWNVGPDLRTPWWYAVGLHVGASRLTAWRVPGFFDRDKPPTWDQVLAALGSSAHQCGCRHCRRPALVFCWYGADAVAVAEGRPF